MPVIPDFTLTVLILLIGTAYTYKVLIPEWKARQKARLPQPQDRALTSVDYEEDYVNLCLRIKRCRLQPQIKTLAIEIGKFQNKYLNVMNEMMVRTDVTKLILMLEKKESRLNCNGLEFVT